MGWYVGKGVIVVVVLLRMNVQMWITRIWAQKWGQCAVLHMGWGLRRGGWVLTLEMSVDIQVGRQVMFQRGSWDLWLWRGFCIGSWLRRFRWGGRDGFGVTGCALGDVSL